MICCKAYSRKSHEHEVSVNGDLVLNVLCSRTTDTTNRCSNNTMTFMQSVFLLAQDVIYTSRAYATMSVSFCLSVCLWWKCIGAV